MRSDAEWEEIKKRQQIGHLTTSLVKLANLKQHGVYAEYVIPPYAFSARQWILDKHDVINQAQCVIKAIGPSGCGFIEHYALKRYGIWITTEQSKTDPIAAAAYVAHWGFYARINYYSSPPWADKIRLCGRDDDAAGRILGFIKPTPKRSRSPRRLP